MADSIFGTMSQATFLKEYWQQKPLLVRQAFPNFDPIISPDELAGMACETDNARLILEHGAHPWEVRYGPLDEDDFQHLPESHWTLLVNACEQIHPELSQILQPFRFIPDWRIDDLMISFATDQGSVGPHLDEYDVFLIQGQGQRHWHIDTKADNQAIEPDLDLRILSQFQPEQDWILAPGDMLYLPPGVAHHGIALSDCMTFSVGFRAPNRAEMLEDWLQEELDKSQNYQRYCDKNRHPQHHPGEISAQDLQQLRQFLIQNLLDEHQLNLWLGRYLSKQTTQDIPEQNDQYIQEASNNNNVYIIKPPKTRLAYFISKNELHLFANGDYLPLVYSQLDFIKQLCALTPNTPTPIAYFSLNLNENLTKYDSRGSIAQLNQDLLHKLLKRKLIIMFDSTPI